MTERRRFSRILHQAPAKIEQRDLAIEARIQDLSLHGLLMKVEETEALDPTLPVHVTFSFDQSEQVITLKGTRLASYFHIRDFFLKLLHAILHLLGLLH